MVPANSVFRERRERHGRRRHRPRDRCRWHRQRQLQPLRHRRRSFPDRQLHRCHRCRLPTTRLRPAIADGHRPPTTETQSGQPDRYRPCRRRLRQQRRRQLGLRERRQRHAVTVTGHLRRRLDATTGVVSVADTRLQSHSVTVTVGRRLHKHRTELLRQPDGRYLESSVGAVSDNVASNVSERAANGTSASPLWPPTPRPTMLPTANGSRRQRSGSTPLCSTTSNQSVTADLR